MSHSICLFSPSFRSSSMSCSTCQFHSSRDFRRRMYWIHGETRSPRRTSIRDSDWMSFQTCRSTCSSCLMLSFCPFCSGRFPYILLPLRASIYCTFVICGVLPPRVIQKGNICANFGEPGGTIHHDCAMVRHRTFPWESRRLPVAAGYPRMITRCSVLRR